METDGAGRVTLKRRRIVYPLEQTQGKDALQACGFEVSWVAGSCFTQQQEIYAPPPPPPFSKAVACIRFLLLVNLLAPGFYI
jgi:hypothetical protein